MYANKTEKQAGNVTLKDRRQTNKRHITHALARQQEYN